MVSITYIYRNQLKLFVKLDIYPDVWDSNCEDIFDYIHEKISNQNQNFKIWSIQFLINWQYYSNLSLIIIQ